MQKPSPFEIEDRRTIGEIVGTNPSEALLGKTSGTLTNAPVYNEPEHYHKHNLDTITFLQEGFPPDVFMAFAIGHIIKYAQRSKYKNGREDLVKMVDYAKRALDWYDKTHS